MNQSLLESIIVEKLKYLRGKQGITVIGEVNELETLLKAVNKLKTIISEMEQARTSRSTLVKIPKKQFDRWLSILRGR